MPVYATTRYHTYKDEFTVCADTTDEAHDLLTAWYDAHDALVRNALRPVTDPDVAPVVALPLDHPAYQEPLYDADVHPRVYCDSPHQYVGTDGTRIADGDEEDDYDD